MKQKRVLFYSNVKDIKLFFIQQFYTIDIKILEQLGYKVIPTNKISTFFQFWKYDIGFFYFYKLSFFPALLSKFFFKKTYFTGGIDDFASNDKKIFYRQIVFFLLSYIISTKCIIVSTSDFEKIQRIYNNKLNKKLVLSYHGINIENFVCSDFDFENKENIFSTVAWQGMKENVIRKGVDKALVLFSEIIKNKQFCDYVFYVIGKCGEGTEYLMQLSKHLNISNYVIFTDEISEEDKIRYLKKSKYYFQLSSYEGFGIAALEALAAKNIIIHSGNGGLKDVVADDGITISSNENFVEVYNKIQNYDINILSNAENRILENFTIKKRLLDFQKILG